MKKILHLLVSIVVTFIFIYSLIFVGGWRLVESGDIVLMEIAVSILVGIVFWIIYEILLVYEEKIKQLEKRIEQLENK